jgi:hypothetical protein
MAETDEYPSTPLRLLLCDARALVIEYTGLSEAAAEQLLLDFYAETETPYGYQYQSLDREFPGSRPGRGIDPGCWRGSARTRRLGKHVVVDWANNMVAEFRTAPDLDDSPRPDLIVKALQLVHDYDNQDEFFPEPVYQIRLVRLHTRDVFAALHWSRLPLLKPLAGPVAAPVVKLSTPAKNKPVKVTAKKWVLEAVTAHPREFPEQSNAAYAVYLKPFAPKDWSVGTIENALSKLPRKTS